MDSEKPSSKPYWGRLFLFLAPLFLLIEASGTGAGTVRGTSALAAVFLLVLGLRWGALPIPKSVPAGSTPSPNYLRAVLWLLGWSVAIVVARIGAERGLQWTVHALFAAMGAVTIFTFAVRRQRRGAARLETAGAAAFALVYVVLAGYLASDGWSRRQRDLTAATELKQYFEAIAAGTETPPFSPLSASPTDLEAFAHALRNCTEPRQRNQQSYYDKSLLPEIEAVVRDGNTDAKLAELASQQRGLATTAYQREVDLINFCIQRLAKLEVAAAFRDGIIEPWLAKLQSQLVTADEWHAQQDAELDALIALAATQSR
jgi:hypothetical protein